MGIKGLNLLECSISREVEIVVVSSGIYLKFYEYTYEYMLKFSIEMNSLSFRKFFFTIRCKLNVILVVASGKEIKIIRISI